MEVVNIVKDKYCKYGKKQIWCDLLISNTVVSKSRIRFLYDKEKSRWSCLYIQFFMYYFVILGQQVYYIKIGDILKITHYFIPLKIIMLLWNVLYSFMEMNAVCEIILMFGKGKVFQTLGSSSVKKKSESKHLQKFPQVIKMKNCDKDLAWIR